MYRFFIIICNYSLDTFRNSFAANDASITSGQQQKAVKMTVNAPATTSMPNIMWHSNSSTVQVNTGFSPAQE